MTILLLKQIAVIGACLLLLTYEKEDHRRIHRSERKSLNRSNFLFIFRTKNKQ